MTEPPFEPDRAEGAPHPRFAPKVIGHAAARSELAAALASGRLHHAWLLTGPRGIGKATLAWAMARHMLGGPVQAGTAIGAPPAADTPALDRILALSEPGLFLLRRPYDQKRKVHAAQITVDAVRRLGRFFAMSLPDGGYRVVIVDAAEEMNASAANALLKRLEEPPARTLCLLVCHAPSRLLPTIRSRCRRLALGPLTTDDTAAALRLADPDIDGETATALARLSHGSVGMALRLHVHDGLALHRTLVDLYATMPGLDRAAAHALAARLSARDAEERRALVLEISDGLLASLARQGIDRHAAASGLPPALRHLAPTPEAGRRWAAAQVHGSDRVRRGLALNLDPHSLILDMVLELDRTAQSCATGQGAAAS